MPVPVTVIIPTYSNEKGLLSLVSQLIQEEITTVIVDNQPTQTKQNYFKNSDKSLVTYLPQSKNQGFSRGVNLGANVTKSEWLLILNDDVELPASLSFTRLLNNLIKHANQEKLIATAPILENNQGQVENYGYRVLSRGKVELNLDSTNSKIDGLTAACLLIKREVFQAVGGFDEKLFAYLEDIDLFLTLGEKKYSFAVNPALSVIHNHLTTSSQMKRGFKEWQDLKNWIKLWQKHPSKVQFNLPFLLERGRNLSGFLKAKFR